MPEDSTTAGKGGEGGKTQEKPANGRAKTKNTGAPKQEPLSPYEFFPRDWSEKMKVENPDAGSGEIGKLLGAKWKEMDEKEKRPYIDQITTDKPESPSLPKTRSRSVLQSKESMKEESVGSDDDD